MRKLIFLIAFNLMMSHSLIAQTFSYQAIIYINEELPGVDLIQKVATNKNICLRFSIIGNNSAIEYQESKSAVTDEYRYVNLLIKY